tara:strand:- start:1668 stop:2084 length:417 start_codon:yes stop_codon:yes gene_type:complete
MKKTILFILFLLFSIKAIAQEWVNDKNFDSLISQGAFDDDSEDIIVIEFWAEFNSANAFHDWEQINDLDGVEYYRCDVSQSPESKKKYRVRMVPTILIFAGNDAFIKFQAKAGLDLLCPVDVPKMKAAVEVVRRESQF